MTNKQKAQELAINVMANGHFESNGACQRKQIENTLKEMAQWKQQQMVENVVSNCAEMLVRIERDLFSEGIKTLENRDNIAEIFERGFQFFKQTMMKE